jgi:RimJ/RimL family protein N-acetyltransferase
MTAPCELRTARLLLRFHEQKDIPAIVRLAGAREIAATTLNIPHPYTEEDAQRFLAKAEEGFHAGRSISFAICRLPDGDLCGGVGFVISETHQRAELGYWIAVPFWGMGYATEASRAVVEYGFTNLGLHRIHAHYFSENTASSRVLEKIGMRHEGQLRNHFQKWNRYIDVEVCGILAEEFRASEPTQDGVASQGSEPVRRSDGYREGE